jgi:hypothetical protein
VRGVGTTDNYERERDGDDEREPEPEIHPARSV